MFNGATPTLSTKLQRKEGGENIRMGKWTNQRIHKPTNQRLCIPSFMSYLSSVLLHVILTFSAIFLNSAWSQSESLPVIEILYRLDSEILNSGSLYADVRRKTRVQIGSIVSPYQIRKSIEGIYTTGLFSQVTAIEMLDPNGVRLKFDLTSKIRIGKIEFKGNSLNESLLLGVVVSRPKKEYSIEIAEDDRHRILDLYKNYGYFQAEVHLSPPVGPNASHQVDLLYSIAEGNRALIQEIRFEGVKSIDIEKLEKTIKSEKGKVYQKQSVDDDVRRLRELYRKNEYLTVKVIPHRNYNDTIGTVALNYEIIEGKKIEIKFVGDGIDESELEQKLTLFKRDNFSETILKNTDQQILQIYQGKGYYEPKVSHRREEKSGQEVVIYFEIQLEQAPRIRHINFEGNTGFADAVLLDLMKTQPRSRYAIPGFGWLFSRGIYNPVILDTDKRVLELSYKKEGYPDVRITADEPEFDKDNQLILHLKINEGKQKLIDRVSIEGATIFETAQLYTELDARPGKPYSTYIVGDDERSLDILYNQKGYIYARISHAYQAETHTLIYKIVEGIEAKFGKFNFDGGGQVKLHVLQREFENLGLVEGAVFNEERLLAESRRRLSTAGLFKEVKIKASDDRYVENTEIIDVNVGVVVKKPGAISVSGGYISSEGIRGTLGLAHNNLFKRNMKISGKVSRGTRGNLYEITLIEPWFKLAPLDKLIGPTIGTFRLFNDNLEEYEDIRARGGTANLAKRLGQFGNLALQYKSQDLRDRDDPPKIQTTVSSLGIEFHRDSRDHFLNPKNGWFNEAAIEYAGGFLKGQTSFFKFTTDHRYYRQLRGDTVLASAVRLGFEKGLRGNREREIISFERFYAGGSNTVRGYPERGLGPEDEFGNHRGDVLFILNTELRVPIYKFIGGALFLDTGNVWNKFSDIKDVLPRVAIGSGVRLDTPLGPARVDIGVPLMREFKPLFYLQLGQAF